MAQNPKNENDPLDIKDEIFQVIDNSQVDNLGIPLHEIDNIWQLSSQCIRGISPYNTSLEEILERELLELDERNKVTTENETSPHHEEQTAIFAKERQAYLNPIRPAANEKAGAIGADGPPPLKTWQHQEPQPQPESSTNFTQQQSPDFAPNWSDAFLWHSTLDLNTSIITPITKNPTLVETIRTALKRSDFWLLAYVPQLQKVIEHRLLGLKSIKNWSTNCKLSITLSVNSTTEHSSSLDAAHSISSGSQSMTIRSVAKMSAASVQTQPAVALPQAINGLPVTPESATSPLSNHPFYPTDDEDGQDEDSQQQGYAMLEFPDSQYILNSLELVIGRDMQAQRASEVLNQRLHDVQFHTFHNGHLTTISNAFDPPIHVSLPKEPEASSIVQPAEGTNSKQQTQPAIAENGLVNGKDLSDPIKSPEAANLPLPTDLPPTEVVVDLDLDQALQPLPSDVQSSVECPFLGLHQPKDPEQSFLSGSNISRRHIKIQFDSILERWELLVLSRNGIYLNENWETPGVALRLSHGDRIQVAGIEFTFCLPIEDSESRSYDFYNSEGKVVNHEIVESEESDLSSDDQILLEYDSEDDELQETTESDELATGSSDSSDEQEDGQENPMPPPKNKNQRLSLKFSGKHMKARVPAIKSHAVEKKKTQIVKAIKKIEPSKAPTAAKKLPAQKAPSKKQLAQTPERNQADEDEDGDSKNPTSPKDKSDAAAQVDRNKSLVVGVDVQIAGLPEGFTLPAKKKGPGRPPKDGVISKRERTQIMKQIVLARDSGVTDPTQMKITIPETSKIGKAIKKSESGEGGENDLKDGDLLKKKTPKPARSPSPEMKESDFTEEQLQRPQDNYVILIFQELTNHVDKKMNLQQIYAAIEKRYPYFKFKTGGSGWQSSVRHNLGQGKIFEKVERDGKGWMWAVKDGVTMQSLREKKKKATPPPMTAPQHLPGGQYQQNNHHHPNAQVHPQSYQSYGPMTQYPPGQHPPNYGMHPPHPHHPPPGRPPMANPNIPHANGTRPPQQFATQPPRPQISNPHQPAPAFGQPSINRMSTTAPTTGGATSMMNTSQLGGSSQLPRNTPTPGPSHTTPMPKPRYWPSKDVIDTFIRVFTGSFSEVTEITQDHAEKIVRSAINRVMHPEMMSNVPEEPNEASIMSSFRKCLEESQPRSSIASGGLLGGGSRNPHGGLLNNNSSISRTNSPPVTTISSHTMHTSTPSPLSVGLGTSNGVKSSLPTIPRPPTTNGVSVMPPSTTPTPANPSTIQPPQIPQQSQAPPQPTQTTAPATVPTPSQAPSSSTPIAPTRTLSQVITSTLQNTPTSSSINSSPTVAAPAVEPLTPPLPASITPTTTTPNENELKRNIDRVAEAAEQDASKRPRQEE